MTYFFMRSLRGGSLWVGVNERFFQVNRKTKFFGYPNFSGGSQKMKLILGAALFRQ